MNGSEGPVALSDHGTHPRALARSAARWPLRQLGWLAAAALVAVAAVSAALGVRVRSGSRSLSCGSGWDVLAGRSGWQRWWAQDLADPADGGTQLVRTTRCVDAVNTRLVLIGLLVLAAIAAVAAAEIHSWRRERPRLVRAGARRLWFAGTAVGAVGGVLLAGGLIGLALLLADPGSVLFEYVDRPAAALLGVLLLMPSVLLVALGALARSAAQALVGPRPGGTGTGASEGEAGGAAR